MDDPKPIRSGPAGASARPVPASALPTPPAPPAKTEKPQEKENVKETIESILVAFILAFVFRAFVVEAFVIPSGSMAPTLLGGHMRFRCEECGYQFDVNYPSKNSSQDDNISIPSVSGPEPIKTIHRRFDGSTYEVWIQKPISLSMHCPNCGWKIPKTSSDPYRTATNSPVHYGDRILVLKYLYEIQNPQRWDVVVFKTPAIRPYDVNYIKRLTGLPGEALMILDGDVYVAPADVPQEGRKWEVQNKPHKVQEALWRVIYDNDFYPLNKDPQRQSNPFILPWQQSDGSGWKQPQKNQPMRILSFDNSSSSGTLSFNKDANRRSARSWLALGDWLPYNDTKNPPVNLADDLDYYSPDLYADDRIPWWYVSDLKVHFFYGRKSGDGPLRVMLTKYDHSFTAEITGANAKVVHRLPDGLVETIGDSPLKADSGQPLQIEFMNVDYTVILRINGKELIRSTPQQYAPNVADLLKRHEEQMHMAYNAAPRQQIRNVCPPPKISITAERQSCDLSHLSLWRDIYYTPTYEDYSREITKASPRNPIVLRRAGTKDADGKENENEYFVLGDNSILSGDARSWYEDVNLRAGEDLWVESGRVPERFLLGKAFFVYWPAGYRPFSPSMPGLIPNFGEMRFIH